LQWALLLHGAAKEQFRGEGEAIGYLNFRQSAVGSGILTWRIPYVFRTPPGWNMLCRGPANYVKDGVHPLEGLVETDWSFASFSMNWKLTRPGSVEFQKGEPVAMLVPQRRCDLESFSARMAELSTNPELAAGYHRWITARQEFLALRQAGEPQALAQKHQKHYFHGEAVSNLLCVFHIPWQILFQ
jgi:hypothetical protein